MKGNTFGRIFRVTTWGESHGASVGAIIDGCPSGLALTEADFLSDIAMRQGGQGAHTTARREPDKILIESGVFEGRTIGTPITLRIENTNTEPKDYEKFREVPRPGHADFTTAMKHAHRDHRGGGRSSARETVARVAAGVIAKKILAQKNIFLLGFVRRIGTLLVPFSEIPFHRETTAAILSKWWPIVEKNRNHNLLRLPIDSTEPFDDFVESARRNGDSYGGSVECWVRGLPIGIGEPVFEKLNARLTEALMTLPAAVSVEVGGGLAMTYLPGSEIRDTITTNDDFVITNGNFPSGRQFRVAGNRHGGLLGGMTTGEPLWTSVHFHAPTSIPQEISSVHLKTGKRETIKVEGRHDSVPLPRAVPMVEAMVAIALVDAIACNTSL